MALMYGNQGAIRSMPLDPRLEQYLRDTIAALYPDETGYYFNVYSGGQPAKGTGGARTGSTRHDLGRAADVYLYGPQGKITDDQALANVIRHWQLQKYGGTGGVMRGGGLHLDLHADRFPAWSYGHEGPIVAQTIADVRSGAGAGMPTMALAQAPSRTPAMDAITRGFGGGIGRSLLMGSAGNDTLTGGTPSTGWEAFRAGNPGMNTFVQDGVGYYETGGEGSPIRQWGNVGPSTPPMASTAPMPPRQRPLAMAQRPDLPDQLHFLSRLFA